jgi:RND family efflux transporter MFP subunit
MRLTLLGWIASCAITTSATAQTIDGFTEPYRVIDVAASEPGVLAELAVKEGDRVVRGELLATMDLDVLKATLEIARARMEARGRLDAAQAGFEMRRTRLEKLEVLKSTGHAREAELEQARTDLAVAQGDLLTVKEQQAVAKLEVAEIQAQIRRRQLHSPIEGVVTHIFKDEAEFVSPTEPEVMTVVQLDPLRITFWVPTSQAMAMEVDHRVGVMFAESRRTAECRVEFVSPVTDAESNTVRVKVLLDNPEGQFRSGLRCLLQVIEGQAGGATGPASTEGNFLTRAQNGTSRNTRIGVRRLPELEARDRNHR